MSGRLLLEVHGGLCSRLRAVIGAMAYCDATEKELHIQWPKHAPPLKKGFRMQLRDMWKHPFVEISKYSQLNKDPSVLHTSENPELRTAHVEHFLEWMKPTVSQWLYRFELTDVVKQAVESVDIPNSCIGIHLRHDLKPPQTIGIEWFEKRVLHLSEVYPTATFFIATDAKEPSDRIRAMLPSHLLIEQQKDYSFDRLDVQRSAADLYILAKLPWFIASNASSYSEIVCFMRGGRPSHDISGDVNQHTSRRTVSGGDFEDAWSPLGEGTIRI